MFQRALRGFQFELRLGQRELRLLQLDGFVRQGHLRVGHFDLGVLRGAVVNADDRQVIVRLRDLQTILCFFQVAHGGIPFVLQGSGASAVIEFPVPGRIPGHVVGFLGIGKPGPGLLQVDAGRSELIAGVRGECDHFFIVGLGRVQVGLRQSGVRFVLRQRQVDLGLGHLHLGFGHRLAGLGVIQPGQHVARLHLVADLHQHLGQHAAGLKGQL